MVRSRYLPIFVFFALFSVFLLLLNNIETIKLSSSIVQTVGERSSKPPGAYLQNQTPTSSAASYCKLNFALPTELIYTKEDLSGTPEQGDESPFRILYNVIEGRLGSTEPQVSYVTHLTKDFVIYLAEVVRYWEGPIGVAAYIPDGDPSFILEHVLHFCYCIPEMSRVSLHFVFKKDVQPTYYLNKLMPPMTCDVQGLSKPQQIATSKPNSSDISVKIEKQTLDNWYPINVCRNAARQKIYTDYVLVCDIELIPSQGLASRFIDMTESYKCSEGPQCKKRVFVVPVFEVEGSENVPRTKGELISLMNQEKAFYFHQLTCVHCQKFPGLEQWKESDPGNVVRPLIETKREDPYDRWEPIYIGTKNEPLYFERLSWEGFQDKMLQMFEMCLAGYKLIVLDGAFLVHWPGVKRAQRKDEPWRLPYVKVNQGFYNGLLKNITNHYPKNSKCSSK